MTTHRLIVMHFFFFIAVTCAITVSADEKNDEDKSDIFGGIFYGKPKISKPHGSGSSSYVRWGRTTCPSTPQTSLVYAGRVGGTMYHVQGGASNYLCLPPDPEYTKFVPGQSQQDRQARLYGAEYETGQQHNSNGPLGNSRHQRNVPCAVCATTARGMQLMIPAKVSCPDETWTQEYSGYLMTQSTSAGFYRTEYICVDEEAETIPSTGHDANGILLYHVRVGNCGPEFLPCTYDPQKEITCVVCSK